MKPTVFCLATSESQAHTMTDRLRQEGFADDTISVLIPRQDGSGEVATDPAFTNDPTFTTAGATLHKIGNDSLTGAGAGGIIGGSLGWMVGIGALMIPGLGAVLAAGPLVALLAGIAVGATLGGITGALVGFGMPQPVAERYEEKVRAGRILISVHVAGEDDIGKAVQIFKDGHAEDISSPTGIFTPVSPTLPPASQVPPDQHPLLTSDAPAESTDPAAATLRSRPKDHT